MSIRRAFSDAAKRYPQGGIAGLASAMGQANIQGFYKKVLAEPGWHLELEELELGLQILQTPEVAQACAAICDHICIPIGTANSASDDDLMRSISTLTAELGGLARESIDALGDKQIDKNEEKKLIECSEALIQRLAEFKKRVHRRAAEDALRAQQTPGT